MLANLTVRDYVKEAQSGNPTPGGGSVAALAGSLGGALTNMVGNLTIGKKIYDEVPENMRVKMENNAEELEKIVDDLINIIDEDAKAFDKAMEAFKLPKETDDDKKIRSAAIQEGYKAAITIPLKCAQLCFNIMELQDVFAYYGNINAITDVGVGTLLSYSGMESAIFNVKINLKSIKDEEYKKEINERIETLMNKGSKLKEQLLEVVYSKL